MRKHSVVVVIAYLRFVFLALVSLPLGSRAFVGTSPVINMQQSTRPLSTSPQSPRNFQKTSKFDSTLQGKRMDDESSTASSGNSDSGIAQTNLLFSALSTDRDRPPNQGTFFYNDEVISHLYGYMYLIGLFAAQDGLFLGTFLLLSSASAYATQESLLPCNPRIPAVTAGLTLGLTLLLRYGFGFEPDFQSLLGGETFSYQGPSESATLFEVAICLLNISWGFFGTWRTKELVNGATYGF